MQGQRSHIARWDDHRKEHQNGERGQEGETAGGGKEKRKKFA